MSMMHEPSLPTIPDALPATTLAVRLPFRSAPRLATASLAQFPITVCVSPHAYTHDSSKVPNMAMWDCGVVPRPLVAVLACAASA